MNDYTVPKPIEILNIALDIGTGYHYFMDKNHPLSSKIGRVYLHRHEASVKIGRWIKTEEHVHHIDENKINNNHSNLEVMSQSEHAQRHNPSRFKNCLKCNKEFKASGSYGSEYYCSPECSALDRRLFEISKEELRKIVWDMPTTKVAEKFGVSDSAIGKRCKLLGVDKPPRGYWS